LKKGGGKLAIFTPIEIKRIDREDDDALRFKKKKEEDDDPLCVRHCYIQFAVLVGIRKLKAA
jgi:hypothetical protein